MPKLSMTVPHSLGQEEATRRLKAQIDFVRHTYGDQASDVEETWDGHMLTFGFTAYRMKISGRVASEPDQVAVNAELPVMAMMFKGAIEKQIRDQLTKLLGTDGEKPA